MDHGLFVETQRDRFLKYKTNGNLSVIAGVQPDGKWGKCRICGHRVVAGQPFVYVHPIGELGKTFHVECMEMFRGAIGDCIIFAQEAKAEGVK